MCFGEIRIVLFGHVTHRMGGLREPANRILTLPGYVVNLQFSVFRLPLFHLGFYFASVALSIIRLIFAMRTGDFTSGLVGSPSTTIPSGTNATCMRSAFALSAALTARFNGYTKCAGLNSWCFSLRIPEPNRDSVPTYDGLFTPASASPGNPTYTAQATPGCRSASTPSRSSSKVSALLSKTVATLPAISFKSIGTDTFSPFNSTGGPGTCKSTTCSNCHHGKGGRRLQNSSTCGGSPSYT